MKERLFNTLLLIIGLSIWSYGITGGVEWYRMLSIAIGCALSACSLSELLSR